MTTRQAVAVLSLVILGGGVRTLTAQSRFGISPVGQGIVTLNRSDPIPEGGSLSEVRLVQPVLMLMGHGFGTRLGFVATLDFESVTMKDGELTPGAWGEGFVDRRHPHTTIHELALTANDLLFGVDPKAHLSVTIGKGFVPFGSDDPMSRPFERYPVNHHLAQVAERGIGVMRYDRGRVTLEGALFDGDEPTTPSDMPLIRFEGGWRFGDSWSGRLTVRPVDGLELQASRAHVHSPESRPGAGPDAEKYSVSGRWQRTTATREHYAMVEYARTSELAGAFVYHTFLAEGLVGGDRFRASYRFERTERPEELRLFDPFRTVRPSPDNSILGISRWSLHTFRLAYDLVTPHGKLIVQPFVEGTLGRVASIGGGIFDPVSLYGTDQVRSLNVGVVVGWGMRGHRMGVYGAPMSGMQGMAGMKM